MKATKKDLLAGCTKVKASDLAIGMAIKVNLYGEYKVVVEVNQMTRSTKRIRFADGTYDHVGNGGKVFMAK
jgi:hypothetical protein